MSGAFHHNLDISVLCSFNKASKVYEFLNLRFIVDLFLVIAGCTLSAFSTVGIMLPYGLSCGGLTNVCRIYRELADFLVDQ